MLTLIAGLFEASPGDSLQHARWTILQISSKTIALTANMLFQIMHAPFSHLPHLLNNSYQTLCICVAKKRNKYITIRSLRNWNGKFILAPTVVAPQIRVLRLQNTDIGNFFVFKAIRLVFPERFPYVLVFSLI